MNDIDLDEEFATLPDLLRRLDYDVTGSTSVRQGLESYAESYLYHDVYVNLTDWSRDESGEYVVLDAAGVVTWVLHFPVTLKLFHDYLDEFELLIGRMLIIADLPETFEDDDPGKVAAVMALLFGVDAERLLDDLGTSWTVIDCDAVGTRSHPVAYVRWADHLVVGLDGENVHVFRTNADGDVVDGYAGGVIWEAGWSEGDGGPDYLGFTRILRESAVGVGKLPLPQEKTREQG